MGRGQISWRFCDFNGIRSLQICCRSLFTAVELGEILEDVTYPTRSCRNSGNMSSHPGLNHDFPWLAGSLNSPWNLVPVFFLAVPQKSVCL